MESTETKDQLSVRVKNLKEKLLLTKPTVCTERAKIYTEVYQNNEAKPLIIKRAIALEETLKRMSIFINDGELVVGNQSSSLRAAPIFPEYAVDWILNELDEFDKRPGDAFYIAEKTKEEIRELCSYWKGKTLLEKGI